MTRSWLALLGLLVSAPLLWAALHHAQRRDAAWDLVMEAATAHERVSYRGTAAWHRGRWKKPVDVVHDAGAGLTRYDWGRFSYVRGGPSSRQPDPAAWCLDRGATTALVDLITWRDPIRISTQEKLVPCLHGLSSFSVF